ncbi:MAG: glycosyltransferase family 4 protein [Thermodesulfovibrionales bacterium]
MVDSKSVIYSIATKIGTSGLGFVSYQAVKALLDKGILKTAISYGNKSDIPSSYILTLPGNPAKLLFFLPKHYYRPLRKSFFDYVTAKFISKKGCRVFHGWNNQSLKSIETAHRIGAKTILECGSTHRLFREKILREEYDRFGVKYPVSPDFSRESSLKEIDLSDYIFLPSDFTKQTFIDAGVKEEKLFVMQRGVDLERFKPDGKHFFKKDNNFKVLFVGRLSLRKGVQYLLEAWKRLNLKNAELILAGSVDDNIKSILRKYYDIGNINFKGFLKDITGVYKESTIFVFPSLEEGSAKVTYEAMASGLPVITTKNSGSLIRDNLDGFIIPIRDIDAIIEKITYFYENPEKVKIMGANALENIRFYSWEKYRENLISVYDKIFSE